MSTNNGIMTSTKDENSFFIRLHYKSLLSDEVFGDYPVYDGKPIKIIQIMKIDDGNLIMECAYLNK